MPAASDPLVVTAQIDQTLHPVASVSLVYRAMYQPEVTARMADDGQGADRAAHDGVYTGVIPAGMATAGQMLRYYVVARDTTGSSQRAPRITDTTGTGRSAEYYGTVIADPTLTDPLPTFLWFTNDVAGSRSPTGARASVFYGGEFYDNVFVRQRGAFTNAESQKFDFDGDHLFYANDRIGRVKEVNLNGEGDDSSFVRQTLAFQTTQLAGNAASDSFLVEMRLNGRFDRVGVFAEQVDEYFLERNDLDPSGALYKFIQRENHVSSGPALGDLLTGVEKKTRLNEDFTDLQTLVDHLNLPTADARRQYLYDNLNLPQIVNYLAVRTVIAEADDTAKNFYLYRDTEGNGEWSIFPWDKDRTFGLPEEPLTHQQFIPHPFMGAGGNRLYGAIIDDPVTREMYLRRLRTVMDELLQAPNTPTDTLFLENRVDELIGPAASLLQDDIATAVSRVKLFLADQRENLFVTQSVDRMTDFDKIRTIIPEFVTGARYFVPTDNTLGTSWTGLADPPNIAQWGTGQTGIGFEATPEEFRDLIKTSVRPSAACKDCTSTLVRIPFRLDNPGRDHGPDAAHEIR